MTKNEGTIVTALGCWIVAFAIGTVAGTGLWVLGGWGFLQGAFIGFLAFVILGAIFSWVMLTPLPAPNELELTTPKAPTAGDRPKAAAAPAPAAKAAAPKPSPKPAPAKKPAAKKPAAQKETAKSDAAEARPAMMLDAPKGGQADDLKKISGVGPKLEQTLNELGIWHYEQVAQFKKNDIAWVDERLRFKGRIERDDWVGQAKELAKAKG